MIDLQARKLQLLANINYCQGQLALIEEIEKCEATSVTDRQQSANNLTTASTESNTNHGSDATSVISASRDPNQSSITDSESWFVSNAMIN